MVARAVVLGSVTGGALGVGVMLVVAGFDVRYYSPLDMLGVLAIYLPLSFLVGTVAGLVEAMLVATLVRLVGLGGAGQVEPTRWVAAGVAALPGLVSTHWGVPHLPALGFAAACALAAAYWTRRVVGATR